RCARLVRAGGLRHTRFLRADRDQSHLLQARDRALRGRGLQDAFLDLAAGGDRLVLEERQLDQSSRVTRRTSSMVVVPAIALRRPFSNIVSMPSLIAAARRSPAVEWRMMSERIVSLMVSI